MLEEMHVTQTRPQPIALIRLTIPRAEIRNMMGPARQELAAVLAQQGLTPAGPGFCHHFRMSPQVFDFEVCVPVPAPVTASGRVQPGLLPAMTVASAIYRGPYEGLGSAWPEFDAWIHSQGRQTGPELWEHYLSGPERSANPADWQTEFWRLLAD